MPNSIPQWSPQEVLKIEDIFTCSGWAHSKGRKCYNRIAKENRELATDIMDDMADLDIRSADFKASLKSLAKPLLCRAYHVKDLDQHTALRRQWGKHIEAYKVTVNARRTPAAMAHVSASARAESLQDEAESLRADMTLLRQRTTELTSAVTAHGSASDAVEPLEVESLRARLTLLRQHTDELVRIGHGSSVVSSTLSTQTTRVHQTTGSETERQRVHTITDRSQHIRSVSEQRTRNVAVNTTRAPSGGNASSVETNRPRSPRPTNPSSSANTEAESSHPASQSIPNTTSRPRTRNIAVNTTRSPPRDSASPVEGQSPRSPPPTTPSSSASPEAGPSHPAPHPTPNTTSRQRHHVPTPPEMTQTTTTTPQQATPNQHQNPQSPDHNRKPISGDCSICCEDLRSGENISWCKAQCGQNFHADCVGVWLATLAAGRSRTCPYCRVSWVD